MFSLKVALYIKVEVCWRSLPLSRIQWMSREGVVLCWCFLLIFTDCLLFVFLLVSWVKLSCLVLEQGRCSLVLMFLVNFHWFVIVCIVYWFAGTGKMLSVSCWCGWEDLVWSFLLICWLVWSEAWYRHVSLALEMNGFVVELTEMVDIWGSSGRNGRYLPISLVPELTPLDGRSLC